MDCEPSIDFDMNYYGSTYPVNELRSARTTLVEDLRCKSTRLSKKLKRVENDRGYITKYDLCSESYLYTI